MAKTRSDRAATARPDRTRRNLTLGAVAIGGTLLYLGAPALRRLLPQDFDFTPLPNLPGFRTLDSGPLTAGVDPLAGLEGPRAADETPPGALRARLCSALFGQAPASGVTPVASFSDYACPYCRVLTDRLAGIAEKRNVAMRWHEWPLLGRRSEVLARAALAADEQDGYPAFHAALMGSPFMPTRAYLTGLAERHGLDPERLLADMQSDPVSARLADSRGLARLFGFIGTPALVVGRTVVQGAISEAHLLALIELEREEGMVPACA